MASISAIFYKRQTVGSAEVMNAVTVCRKLQDVNEVTATCRRSGERPFSAASPIVPQLLPPIPERMPERLRPAGRSPFSFKPLSMYCLGRAFSSLLSCTIRACQVARSVHMACAGRPPTWSRKGPGPQGRLWHESKASRPSMRYVFSLLGTQSDIEAFLPSMNVGDSATLCILGGTPCVLKGIGVCIVVC